MQIGRSREKTPVKKCKQTMETNKRQPKSIVNDGKRKSIEISGNQWDSIVNNGYYQKSMGIDGKQS